MNDSGMYLPARPDGLLEFRFEQHFQIQNKGTVLSAQTGVFGDFRDSLLSLPPSISLSLSLSTPFPRQAQVRAMSFPLPNSPCRARIACRLRGSKGGRDKLWHGDTNELRCCIYLTWGKAASRARPRRDRMDGKGHKGLGWVELSWVGLGWVGLGWVGFEVVILIIILIIWYVGWVCSALKGYSCSGRGFREDRCWVYSHWQGATFARAEVRFSHPR